VILALQNVIHVVGVSTALAPLLVLVVVYIWVVVLLLCKVQRAKLIALLDIIAKLVLQLLNPALLENTIRI